MSEPHTELYHRHRRPPHPQRRERRLPPLEERALAAWAKAAILEQTGEEPLAASLRRDLEELLAQFSRPDGAFAAAPGDREVLPGANGLAIAALARGGWALGEYRFLRRAEEARLFLKTRLTGPEGQLYARWEERVPSGRAERADCALCALGLMELWRAHGSRFALRQAAKLREELMENE